MGLFKIVKAALTGNKNRPFVNRVWASKKAKFEGLSKHILESPASHRIWIVAHFPETLREMKEALDAVKAPYSEAGSPEELRTSNSEVLIVTAGMIGEQTSPLPRDATPDLVFIVEHYPTRAKDDALEARLKEISPLPTVYYYIALSEPLFNNELIDAGRTGRIQDQLKKLGVPEDECLEHAFIDAAIRSTQEKIGGRTSADFPANSQEEWFERCLSDSNE